jgi:lipopolysaccharide/colanic/teichoic acid biosynthesis glycosyltransferase
VRTPVFELFDMAKFRTMRTDAEKHTGAVLAQENDPRVTKVGRFLRKTRLDELPQLFNVLKGEMSLVGPRPERPELLINLALAIPFFEERMRDVKPGITGSRRCRSATRGGRPRAARPRSSRDPHQPLRPRRRRGAEADDMRMKLLFDLAYAATLEDLVQFLRTELGVIAKTPVVMLRGVGR